MDDSIASSISPQRLDPIGIFSRSIQPLIKRDRRYDFEFEEKNLGHGQPHLGALRRDIFFRFYVGIILKFETIQRSQF